jgi:hypothetical protein
MKIIPDNLVPLIYLIAVAIIGGVLHKLGVPPELTGLIVGAGITRVKMPARSQKDVKKND